LNQLVNGGLAMNHNNQTAISYKTTANNCSQIKAKLGTATTAELIRIALQSGLMPSP